MSERLFWSRGEEVIDTVDVRLHIDSDIKKYNDGFDLEELGIV